MDIQKMISDYTAWLKSEITIANFGEYTELTTPYLDRFNDYLQIYAKQNSDGTITLTDDGYIIGSLISSGMTFQKSPKRQKMLDRVANNYNVSIVGEEIKAIATAGNFPQKKHMMVQAMLAVDDMYTVSGENIKDLFLEDVETFFTANDIYPIKDFSLIVNPFFLYFQKTCKPF